ncbi:large conductance mechanosensitive channel protein MscL [Streptomyces sp. NBC_01537]|uniref:large conductance mechanosensitive channel protein MscL n=1 Tax=Streptomyces sp. NBC_01537 TaxID=2903896 RepID=UPI00386B0394
MKGFKEFLLRGNVVELAVAFVIGAAFSKVIDAFVNGVLNPLIGAFGSKNLDSYYSCLKGPCVVVGGEVTKGVSILWGSVIGALITFTLTAAAVYFAVVLPLNAYSRRKEAEGEPVLSEAELLTDIRDLLAERR